MQREAFVLQHVSRLLRILATEKHNIHPPTHTTTTTKATTTDYKLRRETLIRHHKVISWFSDGSKTRKIGFTPLLCHQKVIQWF